MEKIPCSQILLKLRTFEDMQNFARELSNFYKGFILPKEKGFDVKFFIGFLRREKKVRYIFNFLKLLPIGMYGGFNFKYFSRSHNFTKMHLLKLFMESEELK